MSKPIVSLLFAILLFATPALADHVPTQSVGPVCGDREEGITELKKQYNEDPVAMGLSSDGSIVEVFTSPKGETFSFVLTRPDGISCIMLSGDTWEILPTTKPGQKL